MLFCFLLKGHQEPYYFLNSTRYFLDSECRINLQIQDFYQSGLNHFSFSIKGSRKLFNPIARVEMYHAPEYHVANYALGMVWSGDKMESSFLMGLSEQLLNLEMYHRHQLGSWFLSGSLKKHQFNVYQFGIGQSYRSQVYFGLNVQRQTWRKSLNILTEFHLKIDAKSTAGLFMGVDSSGLSFYYQRTFKKLRFSLNLFHHDNLGLSPLIDLSL